MLLMQALKAAQLMGNIPEAIFKHFFRKMAFHVCYCRFPFTPSTHPPEFQNDEILCFYTSKYRTSLVFCSAAQTLGQRGPSPSWNVRSQESFGDAFSASVMEKDSGDLPTRMLSGFPRCFAFCSPCCVSASTLSGAQPSALRYWRRLWYCYQWLPACKNKKNTFIVTIMKMPLQSTDIQFLIK